MDKAPGASLPHRISVLVFLRDAAGRFLLLKRLKSPNKDCWSPIGGKLEREIGESPYECAVREIGEETGLEVAIADLHLFGMIAERAYEDQGHWLMFLFTCKKPLAELPPAIDEGHFAFYERAEIDGLALPETDRQLLWPYYDSHSEGFIAMHADCSPAQPLQIVVEESKP